MHYKLRWKTHEPPPRIDHSGRCRACDPGGSANGCRRNRGEARRDDLNLVEHNESNKLPAMCDEDRDIVL